MHTHSRGFLNKKLQEDVRALYIYIYYRQKLAIIQESSGCMAVGASLIVTLLIGSPVCYTAVMPENENNSEGKAEAEYIYIYLESFLHCPLVLYITRR